MAVESRGDLASRHGSIGRFAAAHSWSYRSDNPICTRTPCVPRLTTALNLTEPPLRYRLFQSLFRIHRHRESRVNISKIIRMLRS